MYWYEAKGKRGWRARYVKIVDQKERTLSFKQEVYDGDGTLQEFHEKFPVDQGHQKVRKKK